MNSSSKDSSRHQKCKSLSESKKYQDRLDDDDYSYKQFGKGKQTRNQNRKKPRAGSTKSQNTQNHKFTCRYDIQIENKEFKVGKKIIGTGGKNMKAIINKCHELAKTMLIDHKKDKPGDFAKLRLRGKGSGYKEGSRNQESNEPLHLCVSSKYKQTYEKACELTEKLIKDVYEQYYKFLSSKNSDVKKLKIRKSENSSTRKNSGSSNGSKYNKSIHRGGDFIPKSIHNSDSKKHYQHPRLISPDYIDNYGVYENRNPVKSSYSHPKSLSHMGAVKASHHIKSNFAGLKVKPDSSSKKSEAMSPYMGVPHTDFN